MGPEHDGSRAESSSGGKKACDLHCEAGISGCKLSANNEAHCMSQPGTRRCDVDTLALEHRPGAVDVMLQGDILRKTLGMNTSLVGYVGQLLHNSCSRDLRGVFFGKRVAVYYAEAPGGPWEVDSAPILGGVNSNQSWKTDSASILGGVNSIQPRWQLVLYRATPRSFRAKFRAGRGKCARCATRCDC